MGGISKFNVLNILTRIAILQPGNIQKGKKYWFISILGCIYFITTCYLSYNLYAQVAFRFGDDKPGPAPAGNQNVTRPEDEDIGPPPGPPGGGFDNDTNDNARQLVGITISSSEILSSVATLISRLFILANFSQIVAIFRSLMLREFCPSSYKWTRDELVVFVLLVLSVGFHIEQTIQMYYDHGLRFNRRSFSYQGLWQAVRGCIDCFISKSFPIECIAFVLVIFTTVVAHNLQELRTYLDADNEPRGISNVQGLDSLLEFEFPREFNMYYTPTSKQVMKRDVRQGGLDHPANNPPVFLVRTKTITKEPERLRTDLTCLLRRYLDWFDLWKESQVITGVLALIIFLSQTVNLCIYAFTTISDFLDMADYISFCRNILSTLICGMYLYCLCNTAQFLIDVSEDLEEKLIMESWKESSFFLSDVSEAQKEKQLSYLLHHMSQNPINLSALGFFIASRSTLTSIGGVIVTYLVVLIQFRSS